jgi:hypothetical protein
MSGPADAGFVGPQDPTSGSSDFNAIRFAIRQILSSVRTAIPVEVISCSNDGQVEPVGTVSVTPLVNQVDGAGNSVPHGVIFNLPYCRIQGGTNAIIIDPKPGDIGLAVFCDRDISSVKSTKAQSNPGSARMFSMADGCYVGGYLNGTPVQYILFNDAGVTVLSPNLVTVFAKDIVVHATESYSWDIYGYGQRITLTGPDTYQLDTYTTGATVNSTEHGYSPPEIPQPT